MRSDPGGSSWRDAGLGWDDGGADDQPRWHASGSVVLLSTFALYWALIWVARGFPPAIQLLLRLRSPSESGR
jgi:hypothetical protein